MNYVFSQIISKVIFDMKYHRNYAIFPATLIWLRKFADIDRVTFSTKLDRL